MPPPVFQRDQLIDIEEDVKAVDGMTVATGTYRIVRVGSDLDHVYVVRLEHTDGPEVTIRQEDLLEVTPLFTCQTCRSHEIEISHAYTSVQDFVKTLPCTCEEESGNDFAAERRFTVSTDVQNWGAVTEDHRTEWDATRDEVDDTEEDEQDYEIACKTCLEDASEHDWETTLESSEVDEESHEYWVQCAGCHREIEFGYSHPERGGRIWPAECTDFNPWKSWPEPRYREAWAAKGWIRPRT